jgi:hypothetical protein
MKGEIVSRIQAINTHVNVVKVDGGLGWCDCKHGACKTLNGCWGHELATPNAHETTVVSRLYRYSTGDDMSTEQTWMSAEQFAQVLDTYAHCREQYVPVAEREPGAFHGAPASSQWLMCEVDAYRTAARILRHLDETPIGTPTHMTGVWERAIDAIRHGVAPSLT